MNTTTHGTILAATLDCGYGDIPKLVEWLDTYDINIHDVVDEVKFWGVGITLNLLLSATADEIDRKFREENKVKKDAKFTPFFNCLDSHLHYVDEESDNETQEQFEEWTRSL